MVATLLWLTPQFSLNVNLRLCKAPGSLGPGSLTLKPSSLRQSPAFRTAHALLAALLWLAVASTQQNSDLTIGCKGDGTVSDFVCGLSNIYSFNGPAATYLAQEFAGNRALQSGIDAVDMRAGNIAIIPTNAAGHIDPNVLLSAPELYATGVVSSVIAEASVWQNSRTGPSLPSCAYSCVTQMPSCQYRSERDCVCQQPFDIGLSCCIAKGCTSSDRSIAVANLQSLCGTSAYVTATCSSSTSTSTTSSNTSTTMSTTTTTSERTSSTSSTTSSTISSTSISLTPGSRSGSGENSGSITTPVHASSPVPTVIDVSRDVSDSFNNKQIIPVTDPLLKAYLGSKVPQDLNVSCITCSTTGSIEVAAGGWNQGDSDMNIAEEIKNSGWIKFVAHDLTADIEPVFNFLPGFQAEIEVPVYKKHLKTIPISQDINMDFYFMIVMPLMIIINSQIDVYPSLKIQMPEGATVFLDIGGTNGGSYTSGFSSTNISTGFNIDDPSLNVTMLHGVDFKLMANTSMEIEGKGFDAAFNATLALPRYNTTITSVKNVNSRCQAPGSGQKGFSDAYHLQYSVGYDLSWHGEPFEKEVGGDLSNGSLPLADGCYAWDAGSKSVKLAVNSGASVVSVPHGTRALALIVFFAAAILF